MSKLKRILNLWIVVCFLAACSPRLAEPKGIVPTPAFPGSTAPVGTVVPSQTQPVAPPLIPTSPEVASRYAQVDAVQTICLNVSGDQVANTSLATKEMLAHRNIEVLPEGSACDAELTIHMEYSPQSTMYQVEGSQTSTFCYTGGNASADLSLSLKDQAAQNVSYAVNKPAGGGSISVCPTPDQAPNDSWEIALAKGLSYFWGPSVLLWDAGALPQHYDTTKHLSHDIAASIEGPRRAEAVPYLVQVLHLDSPEKQQAIAALGDLGPLAAAAIPDLRAEIDSPGTLLAPDAILALARIGDIEITPRLVDLSNSSELKYWVPALDYLLSFDRLKAIEVIARFLDDSDLAKQGEAVDELTRMGSQARTLAPTILEIFYNNLQEPLSDKVVQALWSMRPIADQVDPAVEIPRLLGVADTITTDTLAWDETCGKVLASFGVESLSYIDTEIDDIPPSDDFSRRYLCSLQALQYFNADLEPILPTLIRHIADPSGLLNSEWYTYIDAVGSIGPGAIRAVPVLVRGLSASINAGDTSHIPTALQRITGQNFGVDSKAWTIWWNDYVK